MDDDYKADWTREQAREIRVASDRLGVPQSALEGFADGLLDADGDFSADDLVWAWRDGPGRVENAIMRKGMS